MAPAAPEGLLATATHVVQDFQRVFEELYPHRRPLLLLPKNECGVPKFVCTTIRPTQMVYTELYDLPGCVQFVADFLAYEPLENPLVGAHLSPAAAHVFASAVYGGR
jgi:hypothetical protein